jgi:uncharacterized protein YecT (DUF1311 family)
MKRRLLVLALAALGVSLWTPDTAEAKRPPNIGSCLNAAQTLDALRQCKGIVFRPCVQEPENKDSTLGLVMCHDREFVQWDALLASRLAELKARDAYRAEALVAADKAWRAWLEAECNYHRAEAMGGSAEGVITTACGSDLTAERVILLTWQARGNLPY